MAATPPPPDPSEQADPVSALVDPVAALNQLGAIWSDDFDAYASGQLDISQVHCALCQCAPCRCPEFGTPAYFALLDQRHGRGKPAAVPIEPEPAEPAAPAPAPAPNSSPEPEVTATDAGLTCPACGSVLFTLRLGGRRSGLISCQECGETFSDPAAGA